MDFHLSLSHFSAAALAAWAPLGAVGAAMAALLISGCAVVAEDSSDTAEGKEGRSKDLADYGMVLAAAEPDGELRARFNACRNSLPDNASTQDGGATAARSCRDDEDPCRDRITMWLRWDWMTQEVARCFIDDASGEIRDRDYIKATLDAVERKFLAYKHWGNLHATASHVPHLLLMGTGDSSKNFPCFNGYRSQRKWTHNDYSSASLKDDKNRELLENDHIIELQNGGADPRRSPEAQSEDRSAELNNLQKLDGCTNQQLGTIFRALTSAYRGPSRTKITNEEQRRRIIASHPGVDPPEIVDPATETDPQRVRRYYALFGFDMRAVCYGMPIDAVKIIGTRPSVDAVIAAAKAGGAAPELPEPSNPANDADQPEDG